MPFRKIPWSLKYFYKGQRKHDINYDSILTSLIAIPSSIIYSSHRCSKYKTLFQKWVNDLKFKGLFWTMDNFHLQIPI